MTVSLERLSTDQDSFRKSYEQQLEAFIRAIVEVYRRGGVPREQDLENCFSLRKRFCEHRLAVAETAKGLGAPAVDVDEITTLKQLEDIVESARVAVAEELRRQEEERRRQEEERKRQEEERRRVEAVNAILDSVAGIGHKEKADFAPVVEIHKTIAALRERTAGGVLADEELQTLLAGQHPMQSLLRIVDQPDQLSDDEWVTAQDAVAKTWGNEMTTAISRGRLVRKEGTASGPVVEDRAAAEKAAREQAERQEAEAREKAAREQAERREAEARERAAREEAERREAEAREKAAREEAERLDAAAREKAAREEGERREAEAREKAAREKAAREKAAREEAERHEAEAREKAAREEAERHEAEAREKAAREETERQEAERQEAEAREKTAREEAERREAEAREKAAREEAERQEAEARDKAAREEAARREAEAREKAAREEAARREAEAREKAAREEAARREAEAREKAAREEAARREAEAREKAAREEAARREAEAREKAAREEAARREAEAREKAAREEAARREAEAREKAAREEAIRREHAAREQAAREHAAREQAARERAAREEAEQEAMRHEAARLAQATLAAETAARSQRKAEARLVADTRPNSVDEGEGEDIGYDPMANHTAFGSPSRPGTIPHRHEAPAQSWSKQSWANPAPAQDAEEEIDPVLATPDGLAIWEREPVEEICVVCGDMALSHRCQKCGSWLDLGDLDALFNNDGSNRAALEQAVEHYKSQPEHPERDRSLAVALLNLHRPSEAIPYLTTLVQTDPQDPAGRSLQDLRSRKTVLMVDDDAKANAVFARTLHRNGFSTVMASDAFEVAPLAREVEVDLVLLNANMAGMDGYTLANLLRSDAATQHIPIVMVTAENGLMSRMRSRFSGVDAFFTKPFDTTKLLTTLHRALAAQPGQEAGQESEEKRTVPLG